MRSVTIWVNRFLLGIAQRLDHFICLTSDQSPDGMCRTHRFQTDSPMSLA